MAPPPLMPLRSSAGASAFGSLMRKEKKRRITQEVSFWSHAEVSHIISHPINQNSVTWLHKLLGKLRKVFYLCAWEEREICLLTSTALALQTNSCDQNLSVCLELIEQVAKVQGQLFGIFTATAQEGEDGLCFPVQLSLLFFVLSELVRLDFSH